MHAYSRFNLDKKLKRVNKTNDSDSKRERDYVS